MSDTNLRDTFAAAALTGLLVLNKPGYGQQVPDEVIRRAWLWADAMLRQRNTPQPQPTPGEGTLQSKCIFCDSQNAKEPAAWGIECDGELLAAYTCEDEESAVAMVERFAATGMTGHVVVPLYRSPPTLTDAEREAVRFAATAALPETEKLGGVAGELCRMHAATLRGLLERTRSL